MKKKYLISQLNIDWSEDRWFYKGYGFLAGVINGCEYPKRKGYVALYDRNMRKFLWFKIIKIYQDKLAYLCERSSISAYWKRSIPLVFEEDIKR